MRLLDRIALNRLISMITSFILAFTRIIVEGQKKENKLSDNDESKKPIRPRPIKKLIDNIWRETDE